MRMETLPRSSSAVAMTRALRDVEDQIARSETQVATESMAERRAFFALLDRNAAALFSAVSAATKESKRQVFVAQISSFETETNTIFKSAFGIYDSQLVNDWLRARDLSHVFRASTLLLEW